MSVSCPTCGKVLNTEQGMRQHHTKVHGEALPNRECSGCGTAFYDPKSERTFCDDCNPNAGKHNGNWKGAKETADCEQCGETFQYYPSNKEGVYCSDCVAEAEGLLPENPSQPIERVAAKCTACGTEKEVLPSRIENNERGVFCDLDCYGDWLSQNVVGENHHQWAGGNRKYGDRWWKIRRAALARDDYQCQHCGRGEHELGQRPDVHHIEPVRTFEKPRNAHHLENVVTLCRSCHRNAEEGNIDVPSPPPENQYS